MKQQKFAYSVLVHVLDTPKSTKFVKKHDETQDVQALYADLLKAYQKGAYASILITELEKQIWTLELNSKWTCPVQAFLTSGHTWSKT